MWKMIALDRSQRRCWIVLEPELHLIVCRWMVLQSGNWRTVSHSLNMRVVEVELG